MMKKLFSVLTGSLIINIATAQCVASFTPSQNPVCQGQPITYTDFSSGATGVVTYSWDFGSGAVPATSALQNPPPVTYSASGVKIVTLTYSGTGGGGCSVVDSQAITVNALPTASFTASTPACVGTGVNFTNTGTSGAGVTYSWDFGVGASPATSTSENPSGVTYSSSGSKLVTFTVNNGYCTAVDTMSITIESTPNASFTSNAPQCVGSQVNFNNTGTVVGVTYAWNFGVGAAPATSMAQNPAGVVYGSAGIKTVTLTTTDVSSGCNVTASNNIVINATPVASFTSNAPKCAGANVNFTNTGTAVGVVYSWSFGAGANPANSSSQNPSGIVYATGGLKGVTLTTTDPITGCFATSAQSITINADPVASFTSNAPQCTGASVNFVNTGTSGAGITYSWNFGAGAAPATSVLQNPVGVVYATSGIKTITFTITNSASGCSATVIQTININQSPVASFTSSAPQCEGTGVNFTNIGTSGAGVTYTWDFGSGASPATSNSENPSGVTYSSSGTKLVTFTVDNGTCTSVDTMSITIEPTPNASFTSNAPQCMGSLVNFSNTGTVVGVTYAWNFGVGAVPATSVAQNPAGIVYGSAGIKTVALTTTEISSGCNVTTTNNIVINATPVASFTSNAPQCAGANVDFTNTGTAVGVVYSWSFGAGANPATSSAQNPSGIVYATSGVKSVTLTTTNPITGCFATSTQNITINANPVASFTSNAPQCTGASVNFLNTGTSGAGITYSWNFGAGAAPATSVLQNPAGVVYATSGIKTITFTITNSVSGCSTTVTQTIVINQSPVASFTSSAPQCAGSPINFTNTGSSGVGVTYNWDFGPGASPSSSSAQNPTGILFSNPGLHLITFTVDNGTCSTVDTMSININADPVSTFVSNAPKCTGTPVDFTCTGSSGAGIIYNWNFGAGAAPANSVLENPSGIVYSLSGGATVAFTVTDTITGCSSTTIQTIIINQAPAATFVSNAPVCQGNQVNFTNTGSSGAGVTYNWDFGLNANPGVSAAQNPLGMVYSSPGTKLITFTVNNGTCTTLDTMSIVIDTTPVANFISNAPRCVNDSVSFSSTGTNSNVTYLWSFGPNANPPTSISQNPTGIVFSSPGAQPVTLTVTSITTGCSGTVTQNININQPPAATFTTNTPQCSGNAVNFTNTGASGAGVTYDWDFGQGAAPNVSNAENPSGIMYSSGGNKIVTFTVYDGLCSSVDTMTIVIDSLPVAEAGPDTTICANDSVQIGSPPVAGYTYLWFPSSVVSNDTIANPVAKPRAQTTLYIVTVTSPSGCTSKDTVTVTMLDPLIAGAGQPVSICIGDSTLIGAPYIAGENYSWSLSAGLSDTGVAQPYAKPLVTTTYTLTVTGHGCPADEGTVTVTVHPLPTAVPKIMDTIGEGTSVQLLASGGIQYMWSPTVGLNDPGIYNPVASPDTSTTYIVTVRDVYGCVNMDTVNIAVIDNELWAPTAFTPNGDGKDDIFYIHGEGITDFSLDVYNRWGEKIFHSENINQGWDGRRQITGEELPNGAYIYYAKGIDDKGNDIRMKGMINLIR